ncbi:TetR family transcriptional regulator [Mycobacterium gordonae]|nr:TetR family transcriptional regulator [Mycobacterium gordonae]
MPPADQTTAARTRRRDKLAPDPDMRRAILAAASTALREDGVGGISIAAVLHRAGLSTRAFYRHFDSKDELVAAVFLDSARAEAQRLRDRMDSAATEIDAVRAWVDGRLDLAFDDTVRTDLRRLSLEAQAQTSGAPHLVQSAYAEMLLPLREVIERGLRRGMFRGVEPESGAQFIHGVVWAGIDRHWTAGDCEPDDLRDRIVRFCLRGLGVDL